MPANPKSGKPDEETVVFTIGHSNHPAEAFAALLKRQGIEVLADVRSIPSSRRNPQFNRKALADDLGRRGIAYLFLGKELGAKAPDPSCYRDGRVSYDLIAARPEFRVGLDRVLAEASAHRVALMCAEKEPLDCHRTILVSRHLKKHGARVRHILADGRIEEHADTERRILDATGETAPPLLASMEDGAAALDRAYAARERRMAAPAPGKS
ncbi:MAG: DUF488 domain-containing protein [Rhodospirillales bacterium]|nr:DUF488 domain-containing protein [Rhodospirillales bacterium]